jgi:hypothetical protein
MVGDASQQQARQVAGGRVSQQTAMASTQTDNGFPYPTFTISTIVCLLFSEF